MMKFIKYGIFGLHFVLFVLQQLLLPDVLVALIKAAIGMLYVVGIVIIYVLPHTKVKLYEIMILTVLGAYILMKLIFLQSLNVALIYWVLAVLCISRMQWTRQEMLKLLDIVSVVYFITAVLLSYTPLQAIFNYEIRDLSNRFFPSINRFIGVEGSPAGPDILYTLILIFNLSSMPFKKAIMKLPVWLAILVLLWTASLSNLMSVVLALFVFLIYALRRFYVVFLALFFLISTYIYNTFGLVASVVLNEITTLRAYIWVQVLDGLMAKNTLLEWLLGRGELMEFENVGGETGYDANPHNLFLFAFQFLGIPLFALLLFLLQDQVAKMPKKANLFIFVFMIAYGVTNAMPFTTRGDPAILYLLMFTLTSYKVHASSLSDTVS